MAVATLLALALSSVGDVPEATGVEAGPRFVPGELIIAFEHGVTDAQVADFHSDFGLRVDEDLDADPRDRDPEETLTDVPAVTDSLIARVESDPRVDYAEPNYIVTVDATPTDPEYGRLWGLHNTGQSAGTVDADIDAPEAWDVTTGSADIVVAVVDTGIKRLEPYGVELYAGDVHRRCGKRLGRVRRSNEDGDLHAGRSARGKHVVHRACDDDGA